MVRTAEEPLPLAIEVRPGREIVRQGEVYPGAWIVRSGALLMEAVDSEGRRFALDVLGRGDLVGGLPGWVAEASVRALVVCWLAPAGPAALRDGLARRARRAATVACSLAWDRIADRLVIRLDDLAERFGHPVPGGVRVRLPLRQEDLADLTGATRESVNRALATLSACGRVHRGRGRYVIPRVSGTSVSPPTGAAPPSTNGRSGPGP